MKRHIFYCFSTCALLMFGLFILVSADVSEAKSVKRKNIAKLITRLMAHEHVPGEIIVKYKSKGDSDRASKRMRKRARAILKNRFKKGKKAIEVLKLRRGGSMRNALSTYLRDPNVEYAEPNYIVYATATPDDPNFTNLWGLNNTGQTGGTADADIDATEAWDLTTGSESVVIAVVDTGLAFDHPDLGSNIWINEDEFPGDANGDGCPGVCGVDDDGDGLTDEGPVDDDDENGYADDINGWDFIGDDSDPTDLNGHGTLVAGTIAAAGNNSTGVTGVMWKAKLMPLRIMGVTGIGTTEDVVAAILYANANGAHVINNSWGTQGFSQVLKDAIDASNAVVVCAAGNGGEDAIGDNNDLLPFFFYPASYNSTNIIAVSATNHNDDIESFSNYGVTSVDVGAPGASIYSAVPQLSFGPSVTVYGEENFEGATGGLPLSGWSRGGTNSTWAVTSGTGVGGSNSLEDSPGNNYLDNTVSWAGYMTPITSVKDNLYTLTFKWHGEVEGYWDILDINYSLDGVNWTWVDYRQGSTGNGFITDLTEEYTTIAERYDNFYFGFGLSTDNAIKRDGVYIDDIELIREPVSITDFTYTNSSATSLAAAHVSGIAGLIKAVNPSLTNSEIKDTILSSVDPIASLSGKVLTGGRVNAFSAVSLVFVDTDSDGIADGADNCVLTVNSGQQDTDDDGYGNACDADLDNDGSVGQDDYNLFESAWYSGTASPNWNPDADFDSDGFVGPNDYTIFGSFWLTSGPWN